MQLRCAGCRGGKEQVDHVAKPGVDRIDRSMPIYLISREDLITAKKASGRPQDLLDLEKLLDL